MDGDIDVELLSAEVENYSCLWDKACPGYALKHRKDRAWAEVAKSLQCSEDAVKKRWKTLRDYHMRSKRKYVPSGSGAEPAAKSAHCLTFLDAASARGKTTSNLQALPSRASFLLPTDDVTFTECDVLEVAGCSEADRTDNTPNTQPTQHPDTEQQFQLHYQQSDANTTPTNRPSTQPTGRHKHRKPTKTSEATDDPTTDALIAAANNLSSATSTFDDCSGFAASVEGQLRQLSPVRRQELKLELSAVLFSPKYSSH